MTEFNEYAAGTFCWVDLATSEAAGAKKFYSELFGWKLADTPAGPDMVYTMAQMRDKPVAALYEMSQEMKSQGIPPHWLSYVSVSDVDESAAKAKALGGQVLMAPADVMEAGRMALIQDPTGATVALWQPKAHIGAQIVNEPGTLCWNELATRDTKTAEDFLTKLFGWTTDKQDMGHMIYTNFKVGERYNGGMLQMTEEWGNLPPHWMVYFAVEDCDASVEQAKALGARIGVPPTDIPAVGRFAVIEDPQGAVFTIIKMENPE
jgi:hypothetical protein